MTLEMIGTQSIHPDYSNLHNVMRYMELIEPPSGGEWHSSTSVSTQMSTG